MVSFKARIWVVAVVIINTGALSGLPAILHTDTTLSQETQEVCYHYRLAIATLPKGGTLLPIRVLDIWRQGSLLRVEERNQYVFLRNRSRSMFIETKASRGIFVDDREMESLLLATGGLSFLIADAFLETELPRSEPVGTEVIDGIFCGIFPTEESFMRVLTWIPLKRPGIPLGFLRARWEMKDRVVLEARVVLWEQQSPHPVNFFEADTNISLTKVEESEIAKLIQARWEEEIGALECDNPSGDGSRSNNK